MTTVAAEQIDEQPHALDISANLCGNACQLGYAE
jgi:hypothetical protein